MQVTYIDLMECKVISKDVDLKENVQGIMRILQLL